MATRKTSKPRQKKSAQQVSKAYGFRSGLEGAVGFQLEELGIVYEFETMKLPFIQPPMKRTYCPDFWLPNGIIVETKGRLMTADRQKHIWVKEQHPKLDIRFVFSRSKSKISPRSDTTYAMWCEKNGFLYADGRIPQAWLDEPKKEHP